jgi:hypothetical protein
MLTITFDPTAGDTITEVSGTTARLHPRRAYAVFSQFTCIEAGGLDNPNWNTYGFYIPGPSPFAGNALATVVNYAISTHPVERYAFCIE